MQPFGDTSPATKEPNHVRIFRAIQNLEREVKNLSLLQMEISNNKDEEKSKDPSINPEVPMPSLDYILVNTPDNLMKIVEEIKKIRISIRALLF